MSPFISIRIFNFIIDVFIVKTRLTFGSIFIRQCHSICPIDTCRIKVDRLHCFDNVQHVPYFSNLNTYKKKKKTCLLGSSFSIQQKKNYDGNDLIYDLIVALKMFAICKRVEFKFVKFTRLINSGTIQINLFVDADLVKKLRPENNHKYFLVFIFYRYHFNI